MYRNAGEFKPKLALALGCGDCQCDYSGIQTKMVISFVLDGVKNPQYRGIDNKRQWPNVGIDTHVAQAF
jgi:hypothetical protein